MKYVVQQNQRAHISGEINSTGDTIHNGIYDNNERHDQFHLAGYGLNSVIGINLNFKRYFIQSEIKGGFMNMSSIRTTANKEDKASQYFFFSQANFLIGATFRLDKK